MLYAVFRIGEATSGTLSPSLNQGIGMAYVAAPHARDILRHDGQEHHWKLEHDYRSREELERVP
jgi:glycine cleavage system aminomethyltransferase T